MASQVVRAFQKKFRKSTIVRSYSLKTIRLLLGASHRLAPKTTTRWAEWRFRTPPRSQPWREEATWLADVESFRIPCGEHLLHVWTLGSGPTVLLVHGWGGRGSQLGALAAPLVERGFRVVGFDAPGHGKSTGRQSSPIEIAEAIIEIGRHLGVLHGIIAHSAGAVATTFALHQSHLRPQRLVYLAPGVDPKDFITYFSRTLGLPETVGDHIQHRIEERFDVTFKELSSLELAPKMATPLRVLHDPLDRETPWEGGRKLAELWPRASLKPMTGVGHFRILRSPETIAEVLDHLGHPSPAHGDPAWSARFASGAA